MSDGNRIRLGGLWKNVSKGGVTYLSGKLGQARLLIFQNDERRGSSGPHYTMYLVPDERREDAKGADGPTTSKHRVREEEVPF